MWCPVAPNEWLLTMDFPDFLGWFLLIWFLGVCIWAFICILVDLFRDHAMNGWAKAGWVVLLVFFPLLGALIYLIARGRSMPERAAERARQEQQANAEYIRTVAGTTAASAPSAEIERAHGLLASGAITQAEFDSLKVKALA